MTTSLPPDVRPDDSTRPRRPRRTSRFGRSRRPHRITSLVEPHRVVEPTTLVPRWVRTTLLTTLLALIVGGAIAAWLLTAPDVSGMQPSRGTASSTPTVVVSTDGASGLTGGDVHVTVDERDVSSRASVGHGSIAIRMPHLEDGAHRVHLSTGRFGLLQHRLDASWTLRVDTAAPKLKLVSPSGKRGRSDTTDTRFTVTTDPRATVAVAVAGQSTIVKRADASGRASISVHLAEGNQRARISTVDSVGNHTTRAQMVFVDSLPPKLQSTTLPAPGATLTSDRLDAQVEVRDATHVTVAATLDGVADTVTTTPDGTLATSPAQAVTIQVAHADSDGDACEADGPVNECVMSEGAHVLQLTFTDRYGHVSRIRRSFTVDSTEQLGEVPVGPGAKGADVKALQAALTSKQLLTGPAAARETASGIYGPATTAAIKQYQSSQGSDVDGVAGSDTLAGLTLKIVISRTSHTLTLYRVGKVEKVYSVAVGQPAYPTPAGLFHIVSMQKNPTWTPPNSVWAKGEKPIGPGPGNPLGTRWMGTDADGGTVGMHGTDSPSSIGYSLSHGCIRMQIPAAEDLFDRVRVGTPVEIT